MNFEKIKEFAIEKKVYLIAVGIILVGFFILEKGIVLIKILKQIIHN